MNSKGKTPRRNRRGIACLLAALLLAGTVPGVGGAPQGGAKAEALSAVDMPGDGTTVLGPEEGILFIHGDAYSFEGNLLKVWGDTMVVAVGSSRDRTMVLDEDRKFFSGSANADSTNVELSNPLNNHTISFSGSGEGSISSIHDVPGNSSSKIALPNLGSQVSMIANDSDDMTVYDYSSGVTITATNTTTASLENTTDSGNSSITFGSQSPSSVGKGKTTNTEAENADKDDTAAWVSYDVAMTADMRIVAKEDSVIYFKDINIESLAAEKRTRIFTEGVFGAKKVTLGGRSVLINDGNLFVINLFVLDHAEFQNMGNPDIDRLMVEEKATVISEKTNLDKIITDFYIFYMPFEPLVYVKDAVLEVHYDDTENSSSDSDSDIDGQTDSQCNHSYDDYGEYEMCSLCGHKVNKVTPNPQPLS